MDEKLPAKLYKYQRCSDLTFNNLRQRCLWFSKPEHFNDPFDCDINFEIVDVTQENLRLLFDHMRKSAQDKIGFEKKYLHAGNINKVFADDAIRFSLMATTEVKKKLAHIGVACLAEKNDDILMWSHYADGHQGFCLEFDASFSPFTEAGKETLIKVHYPDSNSYPPLSLADILHSDLPPLPKKLLGTKSSHWSYEAEWRVFSSIGDIGYRYNEAALTGIYFGCKMKDGDKRTIASILKGSPTKLYQMQRSYTEFEVITKEIFSA